MAYKILHSNQSGTTRSSSYIYDNDSLELVWRNGQIHVQGVSSSSVTRKTPSCDGYTMNPSSGEKAIDEDACIGKSAKMDSTKTPANNSQKLSNVLRFSPFLKSTYQGNTTTLPTNNRKSAPDGSMVIDSSNGSSYGLQGPKPLISDAPNWVSLVPRNQEIPPDQQSEVVGHYSNQTTSSAGVKTKGKIADSDYLDEPLLESSSSCSLGASNTTNESTYISDNDEEPEDVVKEKLAREGTRVKRRRNAEIHSLYERKRRDKINKRMRTLKELIPNCKKTDKASMLDDAIEYLKTLKLQLQIMSMGARFRMPLMMLPMINASHFSQLMGAGMSFRPGMSIPCSLRQFPSAPLPAINGVPMFGFPNQVPPAPFLPMVGNPSMQPLLATSIANKLAENQASSQLTTLMISLSKNSYLNAQAELNVQQSSKGSDIPSPVADPIFPNSHRKRRKQE